MKRLAFGTLFVASFIVAAGCRSGISPTELPPLNGAGHRAGHHSSSLCSGHGDNTVTVCLYLPKSGVSSLALTDTVQGDPAAVVATANPNPSQCPAGSGSVPVCVVVFKNVPSAINQVLINASTTTSGDTGVAIPVDVSPTATPASVTFCPTYDGCTASSISVYPFFSAHGQLGQTSTLPLGQSEQVWVLVKNSKGQIVIGHFYPLMPVTASTQYLHASLTEVGKSTDSLAISWQSNFGGMFKGGKASAVLHVRQNSTDGEASVKPASGIVYYTPGPNSSSAGPGGVVATAGDKSVYFAINDLSGCVAPGACATMLGLLIPSKVPSITYVPVSSVPGISQMYVSNGALWMATFQPHGSWSYALPTLRMPLGALTVPTPLPASFGEGSGFVNDASGNLWISGCSGNGCKQNHNGTPILAEVSGSGSPSSPAQTVTLPPSCEKFGKRGFSVGDVGLFNGSLYVLGLNDGSAAPARGALWQVDPTTLKTTCPSVPANFNPSPYFALTTSALVFGAGGNVHNSRAKPNHGFYSILSSGKLQSPAPDLTPSATANHMSGSGDLAYFIHGDNIGGVAVFGLGAYEPSHGSWTVVPAQQLATQRDGAIRATGSSGVWFTATGICGTPASPWLGVCLGHASYVTGHRGPVAGAAPALDLGTGNPPVVPAGSAAGFGGMWPLNVHGGEFDAKSATPSTCAVETPTPHSALHFLFFVKGLTAGACALTITGPAGLSLPFAAGIK